MKIQPPAEVSAIAKFVRQDCSLVMLYSLENIMAIATGLISSLFNVALSRDVPFRQLQQLQSSCHGFTKNYLSSPLYSIPFSFSAKVMSCGTRIMASVRD